MKTVKRGDSGMDVLRVQLQLKKAGYKGKDGKELVLDGKFGPNTEYALKQYQKENGLVADGIAGPKTYGKMYGVEEKDQRKTQGQKKNIQVGAKVNIGNKKAYDWGPIKIIKSGNLEINTAGAKQKEVNGLTVYEYNDGTIITLGRNSSVTIKNGKDEITIGPNGITAGKERVSDNVIVKAEYIYKTGETKAGCYNLGTYKKEITDKNGHVKLTHETNVQVKKEAADTAVVVALSAAVLITGGASLAALVASGTKLGAVVAK